MKETNHERLEKDIRAAYKTQKPLYIWGAPGIGKSDTVRKVAKEIAEDKGLKYEEYSGEFKEDTLHLVDVRVSQLEPSDLRGIPKIGDDSVKWIKPDWLPTEGIGILFLDELNTAHQSIQKAAYQLILDRRIGDYILPEGWITIAAGNRQSDKANVFNMPKPLQNRFLHTTLVEPTVDDWAEWAMDNGIDSRIIGFLKFKRDYLMDFNPTDSNKAFASPRTWEYVSDLIEDVEDYNEVYELSSLAIGTGKSIELMEFIKLREKMDVREILENPEGVEIPEQRDVFYSMVTGVADAFKEKDEHLENIQKFVVRLIDMGNHTSMTHYKEGAILCLKLTVDKHKDYFSNNFHKFDESEVIAKQLWKYWKK